MAVTDQNIRIWTGNTARIRIDVKDESGDAKDLSEASVEWAMYAGGESYISKSTEDDISILDNDEGIPSVISIALSEEDTTGLSPSTYDHECRVTDSSGSIQTVTVGKVTVMRSHFE